MIALMTSKCKILKPDPYENNPKKVARMLKEKGLIEDAEFFYRYARFIAKEAHKIKAGEYVLDKSMTPFELLRAIQTGKRKEIRFTVPQGSSKVDIVKIIAKAGFGDEAKLIALMEDQDLIQSFGVPERGADGQDTIPGGLEGYLFPDTYQFPKGTAPKTILKRMNKRLKSQIDDKITKRMKTGIRAENQQSPIRDLGSRRIKKITAPRANPVGPSSGFSPFSRGGMCGGMHGAIEYGQGLAGSAVLDAEIE